MSCIHCGAHLNPDQQICPDCQHNSTVTVLSPEERESFNGLTIQDIAGNDQSQEHNSNPHVYVRHFSFGTTHGNWLIRLLVGAIFLLVIIFALPIVLISLAIFIIFFIINRIFIGRTYK